MKDMRIQILCYLRDLEHGLEYHKLNDFLSTLREVRTVHGKNVSNLQSIRRSLIDLENRELIQQTFEEKRIDINVVLSTNDKGKFGNSASRLSQEYKGEYPIKEAISYGITLKGLEFLLKIDHEANIFNETKRGNNLLLILIIATLITCVSAFIGNYYDAESVECCESNKEQILNKEVEATQIMDSIFYVHDTIYINSDTTQSDSLSN